MRLLIWASSYGQAAGGGPVLAPLLAAALAGRGHKVTVLTDRRPEHLPATETSDGVSIHRPLFRRALAGDVALIPEIRREVAAIKREWRPDLTFIFSSGYGEFFHHVTEGGLPAPLVVGLHDRFPETCYRADAMVGRNLRAARWVTACSKAVLETARQNLPALIANSSVIHNALPMPGKLPLAASSSMQHIAFVGRLVRHKGVDVLIAAMTLLVDRFPALRLTIAGDGDEWTSLEAEVRRRGLAGRITFAGVLSHDAVYRLIGEVDLVVMPSRVEPFGLVALEAAQMARPIVASDVDGLPEVVSDGETGLLVSPDDHPALAQAIATLLDDPRRARGLGQAARRRAESLFAWDRYVAAHERLFETMIARWPVRAPPPRPAAIVTGDDERIDPRTVPRGRMLDRLGAKRPSLSIVALVEAPLGAEFEKFCKADPQDAGDCQLILARCAGADPAAFTAARLAQAGGESLVEFANRAAGLAIGQLLVLLPPGSDKTGELPALLERFATEPWLGVCALGRPGNRASGLLTRESLWTALGGLESLYRNWDWAMRDFCQRARAIGYDARDWPKARPAPGQDSEADARLFADRVALAPDRSAMSPTTVSRSGHFTVYTAITNRYDSLKPQPPAALAGCEQLAFLDRDTAAAFAGASRGWQIVSVDRARVDRPSDEDPHRTARFHKINAHLALPASDYSLWIDASIGIACPFSLPRLADLFLDECDLCVFAHYARRSVYEEAEACLAYGLDRRDVIEAQISRYRAEGLPATTGLIEAPVLLRRHTNAIRELNEAWWAEIVRGSRRDQLSFNYVAWKLGLRYATFPLSLATRNGLFVKFMR